MRRAATDNLSQLSEFYKHLQPISPSAATVKPAEATH